MDGKECSLVGMEAHITCMTPKEALTQSFHGVDQDELKVVSSTHNRTIRSIKITAYKLIIN